MLRKTTHMFILSCFYNESCLSLTHLHLTIISRAIMKCPFVFASLKVSLHYNNYCYTLAYPSIYFCKYRCIFLFKWNLQYDFLMNFCSEIKKNHICLVRQHKVVWSTFILRVVLFIYRSCLFFLLNAKYNINQKTWNFGIQVFYN